MQTVDFFTPIVDDPYDFGRIAAANALSDVYAMGGRPLTALNVVAFPLERLGADVLGAILRGGLDVGAAAGAAVVGGHSIDDPEPKYGLAVTGIVAPGRAADERRRPGGRRARADQAAGRRRDRDGLQARRAAPRARSHAAVDAWSRSTRPPRRGARGRRARADGRDRLRAARPPAPLARESGVAAEVDAAAVPALAGVEPLLADAAASRAAAAATPS